MIEIKETLYKDERLGFFADQRKLVQKRYDKLEKQIKPDEPYISERREFLSDLGRELSFYNDVIKMLENGVTSKNEIVREIFEKVESLLVQNTFTDGYGEYISISFADDLAELKKEYKIM